ncbi:MAG: hypothetical protein H6558_08435 [Lewinellaceae bacterium]|nr:hypothetical protein [Lewinellaceae bacterium]
MRGRIGGGSTSGSDKHFLNNLFSNTGGGFAFQATSANVVSLSDFNDLYTTGPTLLSWAGTGYATLADWQAANSFDANSLSADPMFISDTSYRANQFIAAIRIERQDAPVMHSNRISTNLNNANYYGILCTFCDNGLSVPNNRISGGEGHAVYLSECDGTNGSRGLVANNFIQSGGDNERYSLYLSDNDFIDVFYNSINNTSTPGRPEQ